MFEYFFVVVRIQKALTLAFALTVWLEILSSQAASNRETASRTLIARTLPPASTTDAPILVTCHLSVVEMPSASFGITFRFADVLARPLATQL